MFVHLNEVFLGEEAGIGHQALIDLSQLGHAEGGIRDEATVTSPLFLGEQEVLQHAVKGKIGELDLIDIGSGLRFEEVCVEVAEL